MSKKTYRVYISLPITGYDEEERKEEAERLKNLAMENIAAGLIKVRPKNGRDVRLTPENSEVVTPFDIVPNVHGMSYAEIGAALSLEEGTVKSRIFRARKRLCAYLIKRGNIPDELASKEMKGGGKT